MEKKKRKTLGEKKGKNMMSMGNGGKEGKTNWENRECNNNGNLDEKIFKIIKKCFRKICMLSFPRSFALLVVPYISRTKQKNEFTSATEPSLEMAIGLETDCAFEKGCLNIFPYFFTLNSISKSLSLMDGYRKPSSRSGQPVYACWISHISFYFSPIQSIIPL